MTKVKLICDNCGKEYERFPSAVREGARHFCSKSCMRDALKGERIERTCKQCGKQFSVLRTVLEQSNTSGNFCCRTCYNDYQKTLVGSKNRSYKRIETKCMTCGKSIAVTPSKMREYRYHFCSVKCRSKFMESYMLGSGNPLWKDGKGAYRGNFASVKREFFKPPQFCAICGTTEGINIHHVIPYRLTKDNSLSNLIPLCRRHHRMVETVSVRFIESSGLDYNTARLYLNLILRERQSETHGVLVGLLRKQEGALYER